MTIGIFFFLNVSQWQFIIYVIIFRIARVYEIIAVFASSALLFMISKELLLRYSAFDSRFYCSFNISKPLAQGWPFLKQWIKWSSLPSILKFNPQLLNDLMIRFFSSRPKIPKSTRLPNDMRQVSYFLLQCIDVHLMLTIHHKILLCGVWKVCCRPCRVLEHTWWIPQESKHHQFSSV